MVENNAKKAEYYKNKVRYLTHIELSHIYEKAKTKKARSIKYNIIFFIMLYFSNKNRYSYGLNILPEYYPDEIFKFEFSFIICLGIYNLINRYWLLRGIKPSYYRRTYYKNWKIVYYIRIITFDIVFRQSIVLVSMLFYFLLGDIDVSFVIERVSNIIDPIYLITVSISFLLYIYMMFYKEKYISFKNYNKSMMKELRNNKNLKEAHYSLISKIDKEIGLTSVNNDIIDVKIKQNKCKNKLDPKLSKELEEFWNKFDFD